MILNPNGFHYTSKAEKCLSDKRIAKIREKKQCNKVKVTTYLTSQLKNYFLEDCIKKQRIEAAASREIIEIHYAIMQELPQEIRVMEYKEIKRYILNNIKFK